jgi:DNA replication protein DnaC
MFIWPDSHGCPEELTGLQALAVRTVESQVEAAAEAQAHSLSRAGLVGWLGAVGFENFLAREDWTEAVECRDRAMEYSEMLLSGAILPSQNWLILHGNYGTGKSRLAASIIRAALEQGKTKCYFRVWPQYLERLKASWHREKWDGTGEPMETEADIIRELEEGNLVVIDDLDKKPATDWTKSSLYTVLNHRYNAELPTILTFNHSPAATDPKAKERLILEEYIGRAVLDRVIGATYDIINFNGPSYRSGVTLDAPIARPSRKGVTND